MNRRKGRLKFGGIYEDSWEADPKDSPCFNLILWMILKVKFVGHMWGVGGEWG